VDPRIILIGMVIGFLIGLSGIGSGSLLAPLLLLMRIPPATVVGSDLGFGLLTKLAGIGVHFQQRTIRWRWVGLLAIGSLPGALVGSLALARLLHSPQTIKHLMGGMLVFTAALALGSEYARRRGAAWAKRLQEPRPWVISLLGLAIGLMVGATSVGSGSLIDLTLMLCSPLVGAEMVGTGIAHGVLLTLVATAAHWQLGTIDPHLVMNLVLGSIPGVLVGGRLAFRSPTRSLKLGVATLIMLTGFTML
jgi:uncharacterized membrane protein YfcA